MTEGQGARSLARSREKIVHAPACGTTLKHRAPLLLLVQPPGQTTTKSGRTRSRTSFRLQQQTQMVMS